MPLGPPVCLPCYLVMEETTAPHNTGKWFCPNCYKPEKRLVHDDRKRKTYMKYNEDSIRLYALFAEEQAEVTTLTDMYHNRENLDE